MCLNLISICNFFIHISYIFIRCQLGFDIFLNISYRSVIKTVWLPSRSDMRYCTYMPNPESMKCLNEAIKKWKFQE